MSDERYQPWKRPFEWPPSTWKFSRGMQLASDVVSAFLLLVVLVTIIVAAISWLALLWHTLTAIVNNNSEHLRNYILALGAIIGVPFLVWRTIIASQQIAISRESLYTQLFATGVERLGAEKTVKILDRTPKYKTDDNGKWLTDERGGLIPATRPDGKPIVDLKSYERTVVNREVRLGAVYALERVALDSRRDADSILETLAEFIKNNLPAKRDDESDSRLDEENKPACQAALNVIGRIRPLSEYNDAQLDISNTFLMGMSFSGGSFTLISFAGSNLENTLFWNVEMNRCALTSTIISFAYCRNVSFSKCQLSQSKISFQEAYNVRFSEFSLVQTEINNLQAKELILGRGDMRSSNWKGQIYIEDGVITDSLYDHSTLSKATFCRCRFERCSFYGADLSFCVFQECEFIECTFAKSNLTGAVLRESALDTSEAYIVPPDEMRRIEEEVLSKLPLSAVLYADSIGFRVKQRWVNWLEASAGDQ